MALSSAPARRILALWKSRTAPVSASTAVDALDFLLWFSPAQTRARPLRET